MYLRVRVLSSRSPGGRGGHGATRSFILPPRSPENVGRLQVRPGYREAAGDYNAGGGSGQIATGDGSRNHDTRLHRPRPFGGRCHLGGAQPNMVVNRATVPSVTRMEGAFRSILETTRIRL